MNRQNIKKYQQKKKKNQKKKKKLNRCVKLIRQQEIILITSLPRDKILNRSREIELIELVMASEDKYAKFSLMYYNIYKRATFEKINAKDGSETRNQIISSISSPRY